VTPEELFGIWAPGESIWSPWVIPVPFAQIACVDASSDAALVRAKTPTALIDAASDLAVIVDLPGGESIRFGLALAERGFRPVPVIDGSPSPFVVAIAPASQTGEAKEHRIVVVDMNDLVRSWCAGANVLSALTLSPMAMPAFLLDSLRLSCEQATDKELFDNRWKVVPQDFPSAKLLRERGIRRVLLVQERFGQPREDLAPVLLRWQEAGLEMLVSDRVHTQEPQRIRVIRPTALGAIWQRALEILGLRHNSVGGFGGWPHYGSSG
jgi:hypothetical protein